MKKLLNSLLLILVLSGMAACSSDLDSLDDGNHRIKREKNKPMIKTVRMSFGGDFISESEEPLMRGDDGDIYAGINVWRTEKKEGAKEEKFAYGLFKKSSGIEIDLVTGFTYRFEASILINDKDKLYSDINGFYLEPFTVKADNDNSGNQYNSKLNEFQYTYNYYVGEVLQANAYRNFLNKLSSGLAYVTSDEFDKHKALSYPRVKRYYGTASKIDPEATQSIEIPMAYKCFGLRFEVVNLPSGYLTIEDKSMENVVAEKADNDKLLFPENFSMGLEERDDKSYFKNSWECTYSMSNLLAEKETVTLKFTWHKGGSSIKSFSRKIDFVPGVMKTLKIDVTGTPNYEQGGNLNLVMSSETLTEEKLVLKYDADNNKLETENIE